MEKNYDIIVVGAGHAGCEASVAAAKMGHKVLLITMDMNKIAQMSCNPAMGGIAKGQIIKEIDALGGLSGIVTDSATLQFRMLNRSKGPAMWSPRAQCDRIFFSFNWRYILENTPNLYLWQDVVNDIGIDSEGAVTSVSTVMGAKFSASKVIITAGTFLNGKLFIGKSISEGGRVGELSSYGVTEKLKSLGIESDRMKTGTPPRIDARSVNLSELEIQEGDAIPARFSFLNIPSPIQSYARQLCCYMVHTNEAVHDALRKGFKDSPLFSGVILFVLILFLILVLLLLQILTPVHTRFTLLALTHLLGLAGIDNDAQRLVVSEIIVHPVQQDIDPVAHAQNGAQVHHQPQHPGNPALRLDLLELCHSPVAPDSGHRPEGRDTHLRDQFFRWALRIPR